MNLNLDDIHLRPFEPSLDGDIVYKWYYSGEYDSYFRYAKTLYKKQNFADLEYMMRNCCLMIYKDGVIDPIGMWEYFDYVPGEQVKIGVMLDKKYWEQQIAYKSGTLFFGYLFRDLQVKRVIMCVMKSAERLMHLLPKFGEPMGEGDFPGEKRFVFKRERFEEIYAKMELQGAAQVQEYTDRR